MCEHVALCLLLSRGVCPVSPRPMRQPWKTAPLLTFCHLTCVTLSSSPRPKFQFPFQNAQYSCVVVWNDIHVKENVSQTLRFAKDLHEEGDTNNES